MPAAMKAGAATTGHWQARARSAADRCWPTTRTWGWRRRRSGTLPRCKRLRGRPRTAPPPPPFPPPPPPPPPWGAAAGPPSPALLLGGGAPPALGAGVFPTPPPDAKPLYREQTTPAD